MPKNSKPSAPVVKVFRQEEVDGAIAKLRRRIADVARLESQNTHHDDPEVSILERSIRATVLEVFGPDSPEFKDNEYHRIWHGAQSFGDSDHVYQQRFKDGLKASHKVLSSLIDRIEEQRIDLVVDPEAQVHAAFQQMRLHARIAGVSGDLYKDGHYRNAILDAALTLINMVKEKSRVHDRDGVPLMRHVFGSAAPILAFNPLTDQSDRDQQEGLMQLFAGAIQALRNPRAHDVEPDTAEYALECISLISFLAKHVDRARRVGV